MTKKNTPHVPRYTALPAAGVRKGETHGENSQAGKAMSTLDVVHVFL